MTDNIFSIINEFGVFFCQLTKITPVKFIIVCVLTHLAVGLYMCGSFDEYWRTQLNICSTKRYGIGAIAALICVAIFTIMYLFGSVCK